MSFKHPAAQHHHDAAHHFAKASYHHQEAARHYQDQNPVAAAHHAQIAAGHRCHADHFAAEGCKAHTRHHEKPA